MKVSISLSAVALAGLFLVAPTSADAFHDRRGAFVGGLVAGAVAGAVVTDAARARPRYYYGGPVYVPAPAYAPPPIAYCGRPPYPPCPLY
ncbi:hypothetical protein [Hansschlegelia zhihuaiae]|uniref:Uncharacterized protein n=1 Tax=Hansschlegelia zhihuaiae TaxID=405005 RepID=A0A4Q0MI65_9HYPH|nr:hypothetical protein [Hansschlegelia zhihuaiae]RXF73003.1 hypothetical protein EK403_12765 [Hansschlegelia zhihuaiae]